MNTLYKKTIDGKQIIQHKNKIVIYKDDMQIFNPTKEMLLENGWEEYITEPYEPTEEELLDRAKREMTDNINRHDTSTEVNAFYFNDIEMWFDKSTRACLLLRFEAEKSLDRKYTNLWYNGVDYSISIDQAFQMLYALEVYAAECYDVTQKHVYNVNGLSTIEEVENYNYRVGYPEKLRF